MIGIERKALLRPGGQDLHELPTREPGLEPQLQALEHSLAGDAGGDGDRRVVRHQAAGDGHLHDLAVAMKLPRERAAGLRIAEQKARVLAEVARRAGSP